MVRRGRGRGVFSGLAVVSLLVGVSCAPPIRPMAKLPLQVEVETPGFLQVAVVDTVKRPLAAGELPEFHHAGVRWSYTVRFSNTGQEGVRLLEVQATVRSLTGVVSQRTFPLPSRVEAGGTTPIAIEAVLSTSNPKERGNLTGVQELAFQGRDDAGQALQVVVRVPLE